MTYQLVDTSGIVPPSFNWMEDYRVLVFETMSGDFVCDLPAAYINYTTQLTGPGACEIHMPMRDNKGSINGERQKLFASDIEEYAYSIAILKKDTLLWSGFWGRTKASTLDARVSIAGIGYWDYFRSLLIRADLTYTNQDVLAIVRALITHAQLQWFTDIGVTVGSELSGILTSLKVNTYDFKFYGDIIEDLGSGDTTRFDFRIDSSLDPDGNILRALRLGSPKLGARREFVAEFGRNISEYHWERDGSSRPTRFFGVGAGEGKGTVTVQGGDTSTYGRVPVRDKVLTRKEIVTSQRPRLQGLVNAEARKYSLPVELLDLTLYGKDVVGAFVVGDSVRCVINDGFVNIDRWMRVQTATVRVQDNALETVDVSLGPEWATGG